MKKLIIIIFSVTGLIAQGGYTLVGGLNMGKIKYNNSKVSDAVDIHIRLGINIGAETIIGPLKVGGSFVQRGANASMYLSDEKLDGYDSYDYLTGYGIYPIQIEEGFFAFGGLQLGKCIGGKTKIEITGESDSDILEGKEFALDYGMLFGMDFILNKKIGIRASYYIGLADVFYAGSDLNWKNEGIGITLLYMM